MSIKQDLPRWIKASVARLVKQNSNGWPIFIEEVDVENQQKDPKSISLRVDGPSYAFQGTQTENEAYFQVNIVLTWQLNPQNAYELDDQIGHFVELLNKVICIYKIGKTTDDGSLWKPAQCRYEETFDVMRTGPIDPITQKYEVIIEASYKINFEE